jgi:SAM-dependent methyltransferase
VVGVDRDPASLRRARERADAAGLDNVSFHEGDYRELPFDTPFDAVVGRGVLMYAGDPVAAVRALLPHLRRGGIVAFQEFDKTNLTAVPPTDLYDRIARWWRQTQREAGVEVQMGFRLFATYRAAGLPDPELHAETIVGGGPDFAGYAYLAGVIRSLLPAMERFGIATAAEVDIETLADRLRAETVASGGIITLQTIIGAAARKS